MIVFLDIETTGLDPDRHSMWELALIARDDDGDHEYHWQLPVDLATADAAALRISRYYDRCQTLGGEILQLEPVAATGETVTKLARLVAHILDGATLVGAVPSFDAGFIEKWLRTNGSCPTWHHRLRCVETLTAGHLRNPKIGGLAHCCQALSITQEGEHTALGDARAARDIWDHIVGAPTGLNA